MHAEHNVKVRTIRIIKLNLKNTFQSDISKIKQKSTRMGFEPMRAEHNGLAVHRLNHSATLSHMQIICVYLLFSLTTRPPCLTCK